MGILLMQVGGGVEQDARVLSLRGFHAQFVGSWVPPTPPLVFGVHLTHVCHRGLHHPGTHHHFTVPHRVPGSGPSFPVGWPSRAPITSTWPLSS